MIRAVSPVKESSTVKNEPGAKLVKEVGPGDDDELKKAVARRRCIVRWIYVMTILSTCRYSLRMKKRFPRTFHLSEVGLLTEEELDMLTKTASESIFNNWWQPSTWILNVLTQCKMDGTLDSTSYNHVLKDILDYRDKLNSLMKYHWYSIPYTQFLTVVVYLYFIIEVLIHQIVPGYGPDIYVPVPLILQLILYMGMLRIGQQLVDPFGDDDHDLNVNWMLDWSINNCFLQVGKLFGEVPELSIDPFCDQPAVILPHTKVSSYTARKAYSSRVTVLGIPEREFRYIAREPASLISDHPRVERRKSMFSLYTVSLTASPAESIGTPSLIDMEHPGRQYNPIGSWESAQSSNSSPHAMNIIEDLENLVKMKAKMEALKAVKPPKPVKPRKKPSVNEVTPMDVADYIAKHKNIVPASASNDSVVHEEKMEK